MNNTTTTHNPASLALSATVVVTFGCGLPDRFVEALARKVGAGEDDEIAFVAAVDCVKANRYAANKRYAPATEGRAMILVETKQGFEWSYVRVELCNDGRWHAAGSVFG